MLANLLSTAVEIIKVFYSSILVTASCSISYNLQGYKTIVWNPILGSASPYDLGILFNMFMFSCLYPPSIRRKTDIIVPALYDLS